MRRFLTIFSIIITNFLFAQLQWSFETTCSLGPVIDQSGNVYIKNACNGNKTFNNGTFYFQGEKIIKLSPNGDFLKTFGNFLYVEKFIVDSNENVYVIGWDKNLDSLYYTVCKFDVNGNLLWYSKIGEEKQGVRVHSLTFDNNGLLVCGNWTFLASQWAGFYKAFVAKIDFSGNFNFIYKYNNNNSGNIEKVISDSQGNFYLSGEAIYNFVDSTQEINTTNPASNKFLIKYTKKGIIDWVKYITYPINETTLEIDKNDNLYFGNFRANGIYLYKYDTIGNFINQSKLLNAGINSSVLAIKFDLQKNVYLLGWYNDTLVIDNTIYIDNNIEGRAFMVKQNLSTNQTAWSLMDDLCNDCVGGFDINFNCELSILDGNGSISKYNCESVVSANDMNTTGAAILLFPNPTSAFFTISFINPHTTKALQIIITDLLGKSIYSETVNAFTGSFKKEINLDNVSKGTYIIQLTSQDCIETKKIVIE